MIIMPSKRPRSVSYRGKSVMYYQENRLTDSQSRAIEKPGPDA